MNIVSKSTSRCIESDWDFWLSSQLQDFTLDGQHISPFPIRIRFTSCTRNFRKSSSALVPSTSSYTSNPRGIFAPSTGLTLALNSFAIWAVVTQWTLSCVFTHSMNRSCKRASVSPAVTLKMVSAQHYCFTHQHEKHMRPSFVRQSQVVSLR